MRRIAKFHKVSKEQFQKDWIDTFGENDRQTGTPEDIYQEIKLPRRATAGSAGYDFFAPVDVTLKPGRRLRSRRESGWKWNRNGC